MTESEATHDVFVSYSRQESDFARRLERQLESYSPPKALGLPARRLRVFLDTSDIRGEDYDEAISRELSRARNLIVLCSPAARASQYVDDEIRRFVAVRRKVDEAPSVVPLLINGIPNNEATVPADDENKAFPEALYEVAEMPLAQDFRSFDFKRSKLNDGRYRDAWFATLATLLRVERHELEERDRRRAARRRNIIGSVALAVILTLSLLTGYAVWQQGIAEAQRDLAEQRLKVAQARELAARSGFLQDRKAYLMRPSMLLAIESLRRHATPQASAALQDGLTLSLHPEAVLPVPKAEGVLFGPENRWLIVATPSSVSKFDVRTRRELDLKIRFPGGIKGISLSADGTMIATAGRDGVARLWNAETGREILALPHDGYLDNVVFGPDDERLISSSQKTGKVTIWNISEARVEREFQARSSRLDQAGMSAAISPDGRWLVATGHGRNAFVWDVNTPDDPIVLEHDNWVVACTFTPDGEWLVTAGHGQKARVWRVGEWTQLREMRHDTGFGEGNILDLAVSPDGRLLATVSTRSQQVGSPSMFGAVGIVRVWELETGKEVGRIEHEDRASSVRFSADSHTVGVGGGQSVRLWTAEAGHAMRPLQDPDVAEPRIRNLAISGDGSLIAATEDKSVLLWETQTGRVVEKMQVEGSYAGALAFAPSDDGIAIATDDGAIIWDWAGDTVRELPLPDHYVNKVAFTSGGEGVAAASLQAFWAWDVQTAGIVHSHPYEEEKDHSLALSDDGARFAIAGGRIYMEQGSPATARIWDVATGELLQTLNYKGVAGTMDFSGDATQLVTGGEGGNVRVWDVATGELVGHMTHDDSVRSVTFSNDDAWIASASRDGTLRVWEVASQEEKSRIDLDESPTAVRFGADDRVLWILTQSGRIYQRLWRPQSLITAACTRLTKNFSEAEWREYMANGPNRAICEELPVEGS